MDRRRLLLAGSVISGLFIIRGDVMSPAPELLDSLEASARALTDGYASAPVTATAAAVREDVPVVRGLLRAGTLTSDGQRRMHAVAGRLLALQGNTELDTGETFRASQSFATAHIHSTLASDRTGQAWCRMLQASLENQDRKAGTALLFAMQGLKVAPAGSPVAARLSAEGAAFALATMGDHKGAAVALDAAWRAADSFSPSQRGVPGWHPDTLHPAELDDISAGVYVRAGNPGAALVHTETGIARLDATNATGARAFVRINAANAMRARGEMEQAIVYMSEALDVSEDRKLAEIGDCALRFVDRAREQAPGRAVEDLAERVDDWHTPR